MPGSDLTDDDILKFYRALRFIACRRGEFKEADTCNSLANKLKQLIVNPAAITIPEKSIVGQLEVILPILNKTGFLNAFKTFFSNVSEKNLFEDPQELVNIANKLKQNVFAVVKKAISEDDRSDFLSTLSGIDQESVPREKQQHHPVVMTPSTLIPTDLKDTKGSPAVKTNQEGFELLNQQKYEEALPFFIKAIHLHGEAEPKEYLKTYQYNLINAFSYLRNELMNQRQFEMLFDLYNKILNILKNIPANLRSEATIEFMGLAPASLLSYKAYEYYCNNDFMAAYEHYKKTWQLLNEYCRTTTDVGKNVQQFLYSMQRSMAISLYNSLSNVDEAKNSTDSLKEIVKLLETLPDEFFTDHDRNLIASCNAKLADLQSDLGSSLNREQKFSEAEKCFVSDIALCKKTLDTYGQNNMDLVSNYARALRMHASFLDEQGKIDEAVLCYREAWVFVDRIPGATAVLKSMSSRPFAFALKKQAELQTDHEKAIAGYREAIALLQKDIRHHPLPVPQMQILIALRLISLASDSKSSFDQLKYTNEARDLLLNAIPIMNEHIGLMKPEQLDLLKNSEVALQKLQQPDLSTGQALFAVTVPVVDAKTNIKESKLNTSVQKKS